MKAPKKETPSKIKNPKPTNTRGVGGRPNDRQPKK